VGGVAYEQTTTTLAPGEVLVLYTDGLVESRDRPIEQGIADLEGLVVQVGGRGAEALRDAIVERVADTRADDVCLLVVRRRG
jgi:serine phosphatase RsbU (regulator of sigma subunit)